VFSIVTLAVIIAAVRLHQIRADEVGDVAPPLSSPWALHTAQVTQGPVERGFPSLATISVSKEITITGQVSGTLLEMGPREGVAVKAGTLLARIDTRELREQREGLIAELRGAKADATRLTDDRARAEELFAGGTISESKLEAGRTASISSAERVRAAYGRSGLRSPGDWS